MNEIASISTPPWEFERHRRGAFRWTGPYEIANSWATQGTAGGLVAAASPFLQIRTAAGTGTASAQYAKCENAVAVGSNVPWHDINGNLYWGLIHHLTVFFQPESPVVASGSAAIGLCMLFPGNLYNASVRLWDSALYTTPRVNLVWELFPDGSREYALYVAKGNSTAGRRYPLTGVPTPSPVLNPYEARLEIWYVPGQYIAGCVDGIEGARVSTDLPSNTQPLSSNKLSGVICASGFDNASQCQAQFFGLMFETYLP